ncbi:MAG: phage holin family protein [Gemmatimonadota bacterium]
MPATSEADSISHNVRGLLTQAERVARTEVELAIAKGRESMGDTARNLGVLVVAGVFALGGTAFLLQAIYTALLMRVEPWLAALITAAIAFVSAIILLRMGMHRDESVDEPAAPMRSRRPGVVTVR